ncbi:MAG TPA: M43 family zinc metalloprotease [Chitinophagales bacterium]|nr:T9SS type A sorting domain-containing protein [Chitinophagales bacterium]HNF70192.1 M43 family zinc metalloprotease [Chitinophagales bacterium]
METFNKLREHHQPKTTIFIPMHRLFLFLILLISTSMHAQWCGTETIMDQIRIQQPETWARMQQIRNEKAQGLRLDGEVYTIPVVVHIVYNNEVENIDDLRVYTQINILNEDFRRLNADTIDTPAPFQGVAADVELEFCLASIDPNGDTTTGIIRTYSDTTEWLLTFSENVKYTEYGGDDAWPASSYLNIWVCDLQHGILGYAVGPGGAAEIDGIVVDYSNFGLSDIGSAPYNLGRTATHEIGHWLGLTHIWGDDGNTCDGDDGIEDTPLQLGPTYGCPDFPLTDACSPDYPGIMFMNYMDYTDDACMNMFTMGQKAKMLGVISTYRASILTSAAGCNDIGPLPGDLAELLVYPVPSNGQFTVSVKNFAGTLDMMELHIYNTLGQHIASATLDATNNTAQYFDLSHLAPGTYVVQAFNGSYFINKAFIIN